MSRSLYNRIERWIVMLMLVGLVAMFQPWQRQIYNYGFHLLLASTLTFIVFTKFPPRDEE
jgi:hypothetical protein